MKQNRTNTERIGVCFDRFDRVIEWLLILLLAFMPLAFGAVQAWSEEMVIAIAAAISICFLLKLVFRKDTNLVWSWAYIPIALLIIVAVLQLIALPTSVIQIISPNTAAIKTELLGDLPNANEILSSMTLSFYPYATKHDLRLVLAVTMIFVVVVNIYRRPNYIKRLLAAIAIIGGAVAVIALAQNLCGNGKIYWFVKTGSDQAYSGTFINHSHFGQFMNLSIGAALALVMVKLHEAFNGKKMTPPLVADYLTSSEAKVIWALIAMIILKAAMVFIALTRGGMVSMLIAAAFTTVVLCSRKSLKGRGWIMMIMTMGAFICVLYLGFQAAYDRLATLRELNQYKARWQIVKDITIAWTKFPIFGTGLGTHEVVYPMFEGSSLPTLAAHAENEYAQAAEETGFVGLIILLALCVSVWVNYVRTVTSAYSPIRSGAYGLGFGLLAIMLHSLSDFGQHLPANFMLSAVFCALLIGLSRIDKKDKIVLETSKNSKVRKPLSIAILVCVSVVWTWAIPGANNARLAEARWEKALAAEHELAEKGWAGSDQEYIDLITHVAAAADYQPDNVKYRHWLNVYRWHSLSRVTDPNTGAVIIPEQAMEFVHRIVDELNNARLLCPTYGATYCVLGQLEKFILNKPGGVELIRRGFRLAPCDPTTCFLAGLLDIEQQRIDASFKKFSKAIQLNGRLFREVAGLYINHAERPDLALTIAGDDTGRLSQVANILADTQKHKEIVEQTRQRVIDLLKDRCWQPDAPASALASLANVYKRENYNDKAIECYRRALTLDYGQVNWRFNLAKLLAEIEQIPEAIHQARICLRLRPQFKAAEKLIAELSVHPQAIKLETDLP